MIRAHLLLIAATARVSAAIVLDTEHIDLSINFNNTLVGTSTNPWLLTVRNEDARREYAGQRASFADPLRVTLSVRAVAEVEIPDDFRYTFLGAPGDTSWILPQSQDPALLYAGISTENKTSQSGWSSDGVGSSLLVRGVPASVFNGNKVTLHLETFSGPGDFHLYSTDAFGNPTVYFDTADGLSSLDFRELTPSNHVHFNWAFSEPGEYFVGLRASGTRVSGNLFLESDVTTFHFTVIPEPSAAVLAGWAALALAARRRRRLSKS